jgi:hypothetical protein
MARAISSSQCTVRYLYFDSARLVSRPFGPDQRNTRNRASSRKNPKSVKYG